MGMGIRGGKEREGGWGTGRKEEGRWGKGGKKEERIFLRKAGGKDEIWHVHCWVLNGEGV